jgi:hypothetical protein
MEDVVKEACAAALKAAELAVEAFEDAGAIAADYGEKSLEREYDRVAVEIREALESINAE